MKMPFFPDQASDVAKQIDHLFFALVGLSTFVVLLILIPMVYWMCKYRRGKTADRSPVRLPQTTMEVTWTVVPTILMLFVWAWAARAYFVLERPPPGAMEVNVVAKQWMWKIQHPEGNREINELHVPLGRLVKLTLTSQDVIHSLFLPAFRVKQDVVPGRYVTEWFKPSRLGTYHLFCTEYCGTLHSGMIGKVVVMDPADYEAWLRRGQPDVTLVQAGELLFRELGCSGCHVGNSVVRAPPLEGVFGGPVPLNNGEVVNADEGYVRDSILFPEKQIVGGYTNAMPSFKGKVTEDELLELVAYIKSLGSQRPK